MSLRCIAAVLLLSGLTFAQGGFKIPQRDSAALIEPTNVARRYCQMDADGFRLNDSTAIRLQAVTDWKKAPDGNTFDVIARLEIGDAKRNDAGVIVPVTYTILGRYRKGAGYTPEPHVVSLELQVAQIAGIWKIATKDELAVGRVSRLKATKWLREQLALEKDAEAKAILQDSLKQLEASAAEL